ncbi:MAG: tRNA pseudouridine(38-40) synthase TruA [Chloroflexi bacterium 13_1_20CM_66_33]|nr:MAG: tRNA pseudouridine(38-40) synthase TruA [Chloroflexi bacterium 13_1_20CM_66_33]TME77825.1 MAG: tRNA pseudouridine(38-40) synthase TruA [Chloroflexota bacterium]TMG14485.1 MAG: tRNA pseudouridine(38-40) synthase TruA [Chloroflexota bacterium]TMG19521.1 MAG: tRNA pseudouridine(38-40) synthase TruA [Chloroflexota bacterium]TMG50983.1 MAG: tRNA pseudouridine(38-40) synthase TruA [Chloroflexota bacterium]
MNVKLIVEYEGTRYHGWQAQAGAPTIEAALREAIHNLTGESPSLTAAGRTDAGVHALGQVVNFALQQPFPLAQLPGALNARLAPDIAVRSAELVDDAFDARYSARARLYAYRIRQALPRGAYQRQYAWGLHDELDLAAMQAAGERLEGTHDFRAFGRSPRPGGHTVRRIYGITVNGTGDWVTIAVAADAFLYGMVRRIAGALVDVGRRRRPLEWIDELMNGSTVGLRLAPPHGLVQVGVEY